MPFGTVHNVLRELALFAILSFFSRIERLNAELVPNQKEDDSPLLVIANHWNSACDPALLSCYFPGRKLHYWAKAALEYARHIRDTPRAAGIPQPPDVKICIVGISYTDKSKYRSSVVLQYGPCIEVASYVAEFYDDPKTAVKKLTKAVRDAIGEVTVNAPDMPTLYAASMAKQILWVDERNLPLSKLRDVSQSLVDLFSRSSPDLSSPDPRLASLRDLLLAYQASLRSTRLTHYSLSGVPLPDTLDPSIPHPLPTRFRVLGFLVFSTFASLIRLPFFIIPLIVHFPIYILGKKTLRFSELEEDHAQHKIAIGVLFALLAYPALFIVAWFVLFLTPIGGALAFGFVIMFAVYHNSMIDDQYNAAKRLVASWRVLLGVWAPHAKSEAVAALRHFGVTEKIEGENEVRRVLRLRLEATKALKEFLLDKAEDEKDGDGANMLKMLTDAGAKISKGKSGRR